MICRMFDELPSIQQLVSNDALTTSPSKQELGFGGTQGK